MPSQLRVRKSTFGDNSSDVFGHRYNEPGQAQGGPVRMNAYFSGDNEGRAEVLTDEAAADAHDLARALIAAGGTLDPQAANQAPSVRIDLNGAPVGAETRVNTFTTGEQRGSAIGSLTNGGYVVVWQDATQDGSGSGIYAQRYDANGATQGAETRVNTVTANDQSAPAAASLGSGYVVVWDSLGQEGTSTGIYAQRYDANGVALGGETQVNTVTAGGQFNPVVASLAGGGYVVAWTSDPQASQDNSLLGVYAQRYDSNGVAQGGETRVNTFTASFQEVTAIASLGGGGYVIVWNSSGQDGSSDGVYAQRYDANGVPQGVETRVNTTTAAQQSNGTIAGLANGGYVVAWQSSGQDGSNYGVYAQRYDANGVPQGVEFRVNTVTAATQLAPAVAALADGGFVVTWEWANQDGSATGVYAQRYDASGQARGGETRVNTFTTNGQDSPAVASLADGGYVIAWDSAGQDGSSDGVYAQRFGNTPATEQFPLDLRGRIIVGDADAGNGTISVTLSVAHGILTVAAGGTGAAVSGSGTGTATINGTLAQIQALLRGDSSSGVVYSPSTDNPPPATTLTVTVNDNGSTGDGGPLSAVATVPIEIIPVNDAPFCFFANRGIVLGNNYTFGIGDFPFSDPEGHALLSVIISSLPNQGALLLNGAPIAAGSVISASSIAAGLLSYAPDPGEQGIPYTSFGWQARDAGGTANGGQDTDQTPAFITFNISLNPVYVYGFDSFQGTYPTIQAGLDASEGFNVIQVAGGTYSGSVIFDLSGIQVSFDPGAVQNMTWTPVGTLGIVITAGDGNNSITTGAGADTIRGGAGNDSLDGGAGADGMDGGAGNDFYYIDNAGDVVSEAVGKGNDRVFASVSYTLAAGSEVEKLTTTDNVGTASINLTGNELTQSIFGNAGANILTGGGGQDTLAGLGGDDFYYADGDDYVYEDAGGGSDRIFASASMALLAGSEVEKLTTTDNFGSASINLTGNAFAQSIFGNEGSNILTGGGGVDTLAGLGGDDFYYIDGDDYVYESVGGGSDRIFASASMVLLAGSEVEKLTTIYNFATDAINLTGNEFAQSIFGNAGSNILTGGGGLDTLAGLGGDDLYYIDGDDLVYEAAGEGNDRIFASQSFVLLEGSEVEKITTIYNFATDAINITGSAAVQIIYGNDGANIIDGRGGADDLNGLGGADTFAFTSALGSGNVDRINDLVSGTDRIALDDAVFTGLGLGALNANAFRVGATAQDADDRIVYDQASGALFFDADGNGAGAAIQFATLNAGQALAASDFTVI